MSFQEFYFKYRSAYRAIMFLLIVVTIGYWVAAVDTVLYNVSDVHDETHRNLIH